MTDPRLLVHGGHLLVLAGITALLAAFGYDWGQVWNSTWGVPVLVLNAGVVLGNLAFAGLSQRPDAAAAVAEQSRRNDLSHNHAVVIEQIRNLDAERNKLDPADYEAARAELVAVGAAAARALHEAPTAAAPTAASAARSPDDIPLDPTMPLKDQLQTLRQADPDGFEAALRDLGHGSDPFAVWRGAAATAVLAAVIFGLWWQIGGMAKDRAPGGSMTGGDTVDEFNRSANSTARPGSTVDDPRTPFLDALQADPNNLNALNRLTELSLSARDLGAAMQYNQRALEAAPDDPDVKTYRNVLKFFIGQTDAALEGFRAILEAHPDHRTSRVYYGLISLENCDAEAAIGALEQAIAMEPNPELSTALARARAVAAGEAPCTPAGQEGPPGSPTGPGPAAPPERGTAEVLVSGTITAPEGATGQAVFVSLRDPSASGPPLGALKLAPGPFPMDFTLTTNDLIPMGRGRPMPETVAVSVRLDSDGDAMSRPPTDPSATLSVDKGSTGLAVALTVP